MDDNKQHKILDDISQFSDDDQHINNSVSGEQDDGSSSVKKDHKLELIVGAIATLAATIGDTVPVHADWHCDGYGCSSSCDPSCDGCSGCSGSCDGECYTGCKGTCRATCANDCTGGCKTGCKGTCVATCANDCTGGCKTGCKGTCKTGCTSCTATCADNCVGGCKGSCKDGCYTGCKASCLGTSRGVYKITLNNQSATSAGTTSVSASIGGTLPNITVPARRGYTFMGYYSKTGGQGTQYYGSNGKPVRKWNDVTGKGEWQTVAQAVATLYARWDIVTYSIKYNLNGGQFPDGVVSHLKSDTKKSKGQLKKVDNYNVTTEDIVLGEPVKKGFTFKGWQKN